MSSGAANLYDIFRKWLFVGNLFVFPTSFFINAPFGRFSPTGGSWFLVDGIKSWIIMELVSPAMFIYTYVKSPLSYYDAPLPPLTSPQSILAGLFLVHYTNRALISPLRTPSRSKSHLLVPLLAVLFNIMNGFIMGSYLSSPYARMFLSKTYTFQRPSFYVGLGLWLVGFVGNIVHDEILLDIRRKAKSKGKAKADKDGDKNKNDQKNNCSGQTREKEHYAIPYGLLFQYISFPNYFCEWVEWFGFALAAAPLPIEPSWSAFVKAAAEIFSIKSIIFSSPKVFAPTLMPPYVFFFAEVLAMLPRAYNGHKWYKQKFGESYPKGRKAVIPFLL